MTLTEFVLARIAEDEAAAQAAIGARAVSMPDQLGWRRDWIESAAGERLFEFDEQRMVAADKSTVALAGHVVAWLPARVLAECEAKRRIVADYETLDADYRVTRDPQTEARRFQALVSIGQLATAHADHPDYDETWRP